MSDKAKEFLELNGVYQCDFEEGTTDIINVACIMESYHQHMLEQPHKPLTYEEIKNAFYEESVNVENQAGEKMVVVLIDDAINTCIRLRDNHTPIQSNTKRMRVSKKMVESEKFVDDFIRDNGFSPTYEQIRVHFNLKGASAAYARVRHCRHKMKTLQKNHTTESINKELLEALSETSSMISEYMNPGGGIVGDLMVKERLEENKKIFKSIQKAEGKS